MPKNEAEPGWIFDPGAIEYYLTVTGDVLNLLEKAIKEQLPKVIRGRGRPDRKGSRPIRRKDDLFKPRPKQWHQREARDQVRAARKELNAVREVILVTTRAGSPVP